MRTFRYVFCLWPLFLSMGCTFFEGTDVRIQFQEKDEGALVTTEYIDISSDDTDTVKLKESFDELIHIWKSDDYVESAAKEGVQVKSRELFIRGDKLVGRIVELMNKEKLDETYDFSTASGERILLLGDPDKMEILETNGKVIRTGNNASIVWADNIKELHFRMRLLDKPELFSKNKAFILKAFNDYLAGQWKPSAKISESVSKNNRAAQKNS